MEENKDQLYLIFEKHLYLSNPTDESDQELIHNVVAEYIFYLFQQGNIPERMTDEVERDLKEEVVIMLRKKIYGYFNVKEYRQAKNLEDRDSRLEQNDPKAKCS